MRTAIYRHFDADGRLLYVGLSKNPFKRQMFHLYRAHWFYEVASISIEWFDTKSAARDAEERAIRAEAPLFNRVHAGNCAARKVDYGLDPAGAVIRASGGFARVAEICDCQLSWVLRWTYPEHRGGTGGRIPQKAQQRLVEARARGEVEFDLAALFRVDAA